MLLKTFSFLWHCGRRLKGRGRRGGDHVGHGGGGGVTAPMETRFRIRSGSFERGAALCRVRYVRRCNALPLRKHGEGESRCNTKQSTKSRNRGRKAAKLKKVVAGGCSLSAPQPFPSQRCFRKAALCTLICTSALESEEATVTSKLCRLQCHRRGGRLSTHSLTLMPIKSRSCPSHPSYPSHAPAPPTKLINVIVVYGQSTWQDRRGRSVTA